MTGFLPTKIWLGGEERCGRASCSVEAAAAAVSVSGFVMGLEFLSAIGKRSKKLKECI
jgi:hypothetical protein